MKAPPQRAQARPKWRQTLEQEKKRGRTERELQQRLPKSTEHANMRKQSKRLSGGKVARLCHRWEKRYDGDGSILSQTDGQRCEHAAATLQKGADRVRMTRSAVGTLSAF